MINWYSFIYLFVTLYILGGFITSVIKYKSISIFTDRLISILINKIKPSSSDYDMITSSNFKLWIVFFLRLEAFLLWPSNLFKDYVRDANFIEVKRNKEGSLEFFIRENKNDIKS
jgi:hypothetical protein